MSDLLPCPFCGSDAEVDNYDDRRGTFVQCVNCPTRVSGDSDNWNTRTPDPLLAQMAEALRDLVQVSEMACMLGVLPMPEGADGPLPQAIAALSAYNERVKG